MSVRIRGKGKPVPGETREAIYSQINYLKENENMKMNEIIPIVTKTFKRSESTVFRILR